MSQNHPYHCLLVPSEAPFELKPSSPGKGWGAFATRKISQGALIFREKPLFVIRKPHQDITEGDVQAAFQQLTPSEKQQFLCLRDDNASRPFIYMTEACAENSFAIATSNSSTSSNINPATTFHGLFLLHSRFNHSCVPNSKIPTNSTASGGETTDTIASFATRDIVAGEEITFCYNSDFEGRTRRERHEALRFTCDCRACLPGTSFQQPSDARRRLIRGLQYLTLGVDLDGRKQPDDNNNNSSASPTTVIIADPDLKKAAEEFRIPISNRFIYNLLVVYLLEEEGLLDDFMSERLVPGIVLMVAWFGTESNARIARLAMARETWVERVCVAFALYGRADRADDDVALMLRMLHGISVEA
ncbi:hypothetical protein G7Y89_g10494 [Cudoniella acicularis]|uniref:SET domain-containing protein n=1 Tax=Cudoniella acicularis TaxID=354080 RepID=A0A8H4W0W6_9HELO|nr:hypothetical protein G7Y89_g10494 [Cudoniella acicularis]